MIITLLRALSRWLSGLHLHPIRSIKSSTGVFKFIRDLKDFKKRSDANTIFRIYPILDDRNSDAAVLGEYFWQDLFVAKHILESQPSRHVDVGSRIDGFIAHLACFQHVEVFDIRPLSVEVENVTFTQWDITNPDASKMNRAECVTCLHTLEHIGLGRYGDKIDPDGWKIGLNSLANLVTEGGHLWLSVPIGIERVEFNAHRVFHPETVVIEAATNSLKLLNFFYLTDAGFKESQSHLEDFKIAGSTEYGLGIFLFEREAPVAG